MFTFFGVPKEDITNVSKKTICLLGATVSTPGFHPDFGVNFSPDILRLVSLEITSLPSYDFSLLDYDVVDVGNFSIRELPLIVKEIIKRDAFPFVIGGDHATTFFALRYIQVKNLIWLDAHLDFHTSLNELPSYESALLNIMKTHSNIKCYVLGYRSYASYPEENKRIVKYPVKIVSWPFDLRILNNLFKYEETFVSIDLDFFNPIGMPAVKVPEIDGPDIDSFIRFIFEMDSFRNLRYLDIVEYAPMKDHNLSSARLIVRLMLVFLFKLIECGYG